MKLQITGKTGVVNHFQYRHVVMDMPVTQFGNCH